MRSFTLTILSTMVLALPAEGGIILSTSLPYLQNFDTLASTGTSSATPFGWEFAETGSNADGLYAAGTGSSTTGNTYSFGTSGSADRAFGELTSSSLVSVMGASFTNAGTTDIESFTIAYWGEQWRIGNTDAPRTDRLNFQYSLDASSVTTGTWTDFDTLDFLSPVMTATNVGPLDGNATANRAQMSGTIDGLSLNPADSLWIRWSALDVTGSDDGLAIDDFSLSAQFAAIPEPTSLPLLIATALSASILRKRRKNSGQPGSSPS